MSLLIHLPLINDTNNQGLLEVPNYSYNTLSQQDDGKIGIHCYNGTALYHFNQDPLGNEWSIALWFKKTSNWNSSNDILICKNNNGTTSQFYLSVYGSGSYLNLGINGNWSAGVGQVSYTFETNTWYHIAATYDGTNYAMYVNGEKIDSGQYESTQYAGCYNLSFNCRSNSEDGTSVTGVSSKCLNDVKIYNRVLSQLEISNLSKALVLHYPLDGNNGALTNENLIINSGQSVESAKSSNGSAYTNANAHLFSDYGTELFIGNMTDEYTVSYDYEAVGAESQEGHSAYIYNQVNGSQIQFGSSTYLASANQKGHASFTSKLTTTQAEHSNRPFTLRFRLRYAVDGAYFIVKNVKLEKGTIATPWCPSPEDALYTALGYNDGIEYDTSGYKNNATGTNNLSYSLDSPRYLASAVCNYSNGLTIPKIFSDICNNQHMSFAFWLKRTADFEVGEEDIYNGIATIYIRKDYNNNPYRLFISWNHATDDSVKVNTWTMYNTPLDTWVHIVITFDSGVLKMYANGELISTSDRTETGTYMQGNRETSLGNFTGKLSDFRIYASCLSDTEIQKLYTVSASIDSSGNAYSSAYMEG